MNPTLEDLVRSAKASGSAVGDGVAVIYYDFGKTPTSGTLGAKKVQLTIPADRFIESGFLRAETATTGAFVPQVVVSGDVFPAQAPLAAGAVVNAIRTATGLLSREVMLNVTAVATGKILIFLRIFPL